jgi:hypothetical protein
MMVSAPPWNKSSLTHPRPLVLCSNVDGDPVDVGFYL